MWIMFFALIIIFGIFGFILWRRYKNSMVVGDLVLDHYTDGRIICYMALTTDIDSIGSCSHVTLKVKNVKISQK